MSQVFFIRHAQTGMSGRFCGHSDPDLSPLGRAQLKDLTAELASEQIEKVYSSDLKRASQTAHAIAAPRDLELEIRPSLREIYFGEWEGLSWAEIEQRDPEYARKWMAEFPNVTAPEGEAFAAFEERVLAEMKYLLAPGQATAAIVTHAGVLRVLLRHFCGRSETEAWQQTQSYCCVVRYDLDLPGEQP